MRNLCTLLISLGASCVQGLLPASFILICLDYSRLMLSPQPSVFQVQEQYPLEIISRECSSPLALMGTKSPERNVSDCSYTCTTVGHAAGLETSSRRLKGEVCGLSLLNQRTDSSAAYVVRYVILDTLFQFIQVWGERRRVHVPEVSASDTPATIVPTIHFTYTNIQANKCTLAEAWHSANMGKDPRSRTKLEQLCRAQVSVSAEYAKNAEQTPGEIAQRLYGSHVSRRMSTEHP